MILCKIGLHKYSRVSSTDWDYTQSFKTRTHFYECLICHKVKEELEIERSD